MKTFRKNLLKDFLEGKQFFATLIIDIVVILLVNNSLIKITLNIYLQDRVIAAAWLLTFPRGDQAWHSHLNGGFPKYSKIKSLDIVAVTSWK